MDVRTATELQALSDQAALDDGEILNRPTMRELAQALAHLAAQERSDAFSLHPSILATRFRAGLRRTTEGLVDAIAEAVPDQDAPVLLFVDQFEELFRAVPLRAERGRNRRGR